MWFADGEWWIKRRGGDPVIHSVDQARKSKRAVHQYVERDPRRRIP